MTSISNHYFYVTSLKLKPLSLTKIFKVIFTNFELLSIVLSIQSHTVGFLKAILFVFSLARLFKFEVNDSLYGLDNGFPGALENGKTLKTITNKIMSAA